MSEFDKLDNIHSMSDEEFDMFIKSELKSSLMEDIKVDEELICKTVQAIESREREDELIFDTMDSTQEHTKVINFKRYIPIISMVACACFVVIAGSLVYTKIGRKTSDNAYMSSDGNSEGTKNDSFSVVEPGYNEPQEWMPESDMKDEITNSTQNNIQDSEDSNDIHIDGNWWDTEVDGMPEKEEGLEQDGNEPENNESLMETPENEHKEEDNLPKKNILKIIFEIISSIFPLKDI